MRIPKSVPLRAITVNTVAPSIPSAGSSMAFPAGIDRFRKK